MKSNKTRIQFMTKILLFLHCEIKFSLVKTNDSKNVYVNSRVNMFQLPTRKKKKISVLINSFCLSSIDYTIFSNELFELNL